MNSPVGPNWAKNKARREREQANMERIERENQAQRDRDAPFDDAVENARRDLRLFAGDNDSGLVAEKIEELIDAKLRRAAYKLGLDPDELY